MADPMSAMSAPNAPERIEISVACGNCGDSAVDELDPGHVYCLGCQEVVPPIKVPYVRADRVTPDMVDRGARKLAQLWGDVEWDELEPEAVESYRRDAEAALRAALHREGLLREGSNDG